ncbi:MAG: MBL fold metallo-hydrolase [Anaerolineales bacterium]|nr:MAG: MBL fold metallo-hydrolase [Anaerolineales bacterium]
MPELVILGSAAAIPAPQHHNTHMALVDPQGVILIDCGGTPTLRLAEAGIVPDQISDVILTHFHPDHVGGLPLLLMNMWLLGRKKALRIYGLHHTLKRVEDLMGFYQWEDWPQFFQVAFHRLPEQEGIQVLKRGNLSISCSPVRHVVPTIGLRIDFDHGYSIAYSSDTEPCQAVTNLAQGADVLIHEASGASVGHSTATQAAETASQAGVGQLYLIHYPPEAAKDGEMLEAAQKSFSGNIVLAQDLMHIAVPSG